MRKIFFFLMILASGRGYAQVFGGNPPSVRWRQIDTDSVRVIFPRGLESGARRVAATVSYLDHHNRVSIGPRAQKMNIILENRTVESKPFGSYDLYTSSRIDDATESTLRSSVRAALIAARLHSSGLDPANMARVEQVIQPDSVVVSAAGDHSGSRGIARFLPVACGILVFIGVIMGGQVMMTSTVEEKSSRVIEVLLAAVSPLELMYGKLLGQLGVGLTMTAVYIALALYGLAQFSLAGLLDPMLIVYLLAFYVVTFLVFGSLMLTIGSAVNQMADAQSLMGPVMILLVVGYASTPFIGLAPNSSFSVALSFTPFINNFAMLARAASNAPPPGWEVGLTLLISCLTAAAVVWFAAKVFKIALLMHGKPPSLGTLIKWARMA